MMNLLKTLNWTQTTHISNLVEKADYGKKLVKLKRKYIFMTMVIMLLHGNLISCRQIILRQG